MMLAPNSTPSLATHPSTFFVATFCSLLSLSAALTAQDETVPYENHSKPLNDGFKFPDSDWPWWRGPNRNGTASPNQSPPTQWERNQNTLWKTLIPGRGYSSMSIVGNHILLVTSDESTGAQSLLCLNRDTGNLLWNTTVHPSGGMRKNEKSTAASSTPACDGENVFVCFPNSDSLVTSALDLQGKILWQTKVCDYVEHQGYGASPALYQSLVIVAADNKGGGAIAGLDRKTGAIIWKHSRPKLPNYPSPILLNLFGKDQVLLTGCDKITSLNPLNGELLWESPGATTECVTSTLTNGTLVYTSGGYPRNHMSAILADGSGKIAWENENRVYVPSLLILNNTLYGVLDAGIAAAWDASTGKELWKHRLGGTFSASPILVGNHIYAFNESGEAFIYLATPDGFELIEKNKLGDELLATPVICNGHIYYRCAEEIDGKRQEILYCIGVQK